MSALAGQDRDIWSYVHLTLSRPWFFATYSLNSPQGQVGETALLSSVEQVSQLLEGGSDSVEVQQLMLVSPGELNRAGSWQMEPLLEIWRGRLADSNDRVLMYRLADGRHYIDCHRQEVELSQLSDLACLATFQSQLT